MGKFLTQLTKMSTSMFNSEVELNKFIGSIDVIPYAFRAISETTMAYELHTIPSGIKVLAFDCPADYTTAFLNAKLIDLVSSENNKVVDFISTKVHSKFLINEAAVRMFENLSDDLKEVEKKHINTPLVITGSGLGGYLAILSALRLHQAVDGEESNGSKNTKRPICITFGCPLLGDIALQHAISERPPWKSNFLNVVAKMDPVPSFLSSGVYKPFGTYLFCTESGGRATFEDQDLILAVLQEMASLSFGNMEMHNYDNDLMSIRKKVLYRGGASELGEFNFNFLRAGLTLQLLEVDMLKNISNSLVVKMEGRQVKIIRMNRYKYDSTMKLNEMNLSLSFIDLYMKTTRSKGGYYNCYKNAVTRDEIEKQQLIVKHQRILNHYWKKTVEEKDILQRKRWLYGGTNYRRILEPLDIAEYYGKGKKNYIENRPNHYKLLEKWLDKVEKDSNPSGQTNMTTGLTHDSCFWAYVEEAVISLRDLEERGSSNSELDIAQGLKSFEANVRRALSVVRSRWIDS